MLLAGDAHAARRVVITGGGWGHGIGMSQYGAYGRALNGDSATDILEHYYTGVTVETAPMPKAVRVGLLQARTSISASPSSLGSSGKVVIRVSGGERIASGAARADWRFESSSRGGVRVHKNGALVTRDGKTVFGSTTKPVVMVFARFGTIVHVAEKGLNYAHGRMEVGTYSSSSCAAGYCLRLVLRAPMHRYLYGLGEMPSSWPQAALQAQAIAGRTYAHEKITRSGQHRYPCDCALYDSSIDQVYVGDAKRTGSGRYWTNWKGAVDATRAMVVTYGGRPIRPYYSSSSGGHTENNENVWGGSPIPYLRGVRDAADDVAANPNHRWRVEMDWPTFSRRLDAVYGTGRLERFELVAPFGVSGRVTVVKGHNAGGVRIVGSARTVRASGSSIRSALGLKDSLFRVDVRRTSGASTASTTVGAGARGSFLAPLAIDGAKPSGSLDNSDNGRVRGARR